jgi:hypothetical protein
VGAALAAATAQAQATAATPAPDPMVSLAPAATPAGTQDRTLGGHVFIPEVMVRTPFAATQVQANLLYGSGTAKGTAQVGTGGVRLADDTYEFASMSQIAGYEKKIADGISAGGGITADLISGIDGKSVVVMGTQIGYGLFGRFTAGRELGPVRAAFTFDATYGPRYGIFILNLLDKAFNGTPGDAIRAQSLVFTSDNAWSLYPGAAVAWAPLRELGITASADYQWVSQKADTGTHTASAIDAGVAADYDFGVTTSVPVGLLAAWHWTGPIGSDSFLTHVTDWSLGVFYTGRPALVMGLELGRRSFQYRTLDTDMNVVQLRVQYFW